MDQRLRYNKKVSIYGDDYNFLSHCFKPSLFFSVNDKVASICTKLEFILQLNMLQLQLFLCTSFSKERNDRRLCSPSMEV